MKRASWVIVLVVAPSALVAQQARDFEMHRIADGVYTFIQKDPLASPVDGNTTVIVTDRDVVVVDTRITPGSANEVIKEIRKLTPKPVRYVINTHWHSDHHYGNDTFRRAYPGVEFIAHAFTLADMLKQDTDSMLRRNVDSMYPRMTAERRRYLATGMDADATPLSRDARASYVQELSLLEYFAREFKHLRIVPPTLTIRDRLRLERGNRVIDVRYLGRANTRGDLVVHLPRDRIVITGDIVVAPVPFSFGSYLGDWSVTLDSLASLEADIIVPGHGPIQRDRSYLRRLQALLRTTSLQARQAVAEGKNLESMRASLKLDSLRKEFTGGQPVLDRIFQQVFVTPASERAFLEARGELRDSVTALP